MRHWGTNSTVFRPESRSLLQCLSCSTLHIACFHPETLLGLEICSKSSLNAQTVLPDAVKSSIWAAAPHLGCAVFTQHVTNYRTGKRWTTPAQERACKGHSISFSFGKDTTFVSSLASALQWCQLPVFVLIEEVQTRWTAPHQCGLGTNQVEAGSPANIPACMLELSDFVFS